MNLMTQRGPGEPAAHGSDATRTGPRRTATGDARHRQGGSTPAGSTRKSSLDFRPPCRLGSRAFESQQAELSGVDARQVADRPCWVAGDARETGIHRQTGGRVNIHRFVLTERNPETRGTFVAPREHGGVGDRFGRV